MSLPQVEQFDVELDEAVEQAVTKMLTARYPNLTGFGREMLELSLAVRHE